MIRVLIADSVAARREQIRAALVADPEMEVAGQARDGQEALQMAHALGPDIVLLADDLAVSDGYQTAERLAAFWPVSGKYPSLGGRLAGRPAAGDAGWGKRTSRLALRARRIAGNGSAALGGRQGGGRGAAFAAEADPRSAARVIAVSGAKGGIGKTTLAVNLAAALATETGEPTVLLDLYTQFADAALLLNLSPRRTLADLAPLEPDEIDERLLEDHLERHESGLRVLAGATTPLPLDALSPECLDHILGLLKRGHKYIVLDVPPVLHATTLHALSHASLALLICQSV